MKATIHPPYFEKAIFHCACGNTWTGGATLPEINVEICSNCHPFYTGKEKLIDTRGRIEKFTKRTQRHQDIAKAVQPKKPRVKKNIKA
ncbi:MAG: 50S ribosomal protein L31 [Candidatus Yanofskybacteria bacterium RIFCSPLOWO2_01_FULL_49_25]|uniref:50S ribosomal protein L31 n=1 Tax=Candidatus Yanofskybacteria bacterium RIFCSPLOWO2_01_FULL_49_25 TaxID=1802701 RepID=A0A1F8GTB5_9BACT|nr:MAG: 50S ribosomal protein L31 [Candidatus Yanofskybacteria bacterium RIFCSPLOWO2_01_FULL_49_25]